MMVVGTMQTNGIECFNGNANANTNATVLDAINGQYIDNNKRTIGYRCQQYNCNEYTDHRNANINGIILWYVVFDGCICSLITHATNQTT